MNRRTFGIAILILGLGLGLLGGKAHSQDGILLPLIEVTPSSYDFGNVPLGAVATTRLTVRNLGQAPLIVSQVKAKAPFTAGVTSFTLQGGQARNVQIMFVPTSPVAYSSQVTFTSNAHNTPNLSVPLTGTGVQ